MTPNHPRGFSTQRFLNHPAISRYPTASDCPEGFLYSTVSSTLRLCPTLRFPSPSGFPLPYGISLGVSEIRSLEFDSGAELCDEWWMEYINRDCVTDASDPVLDHPPKSQPLDPGDVPNVYTSSLKNNTIPQRQKSPLQNEEGGGVRQGRRPRSKWGRPSLVEYPGFL